MALGEQVQEGTHLGGQVAAARVDGEDGDARRRQLLEHGHEHACAQVLRHQRGGQLHQAQPRAHRGVARAHAGHPQPALHGHRARAARAGEEPHLVRAGLREQHALVRVAARPGCAGCRGGSGRRGSRSSRCARCPAGAPPARSPAGGRCAARRRTPRRAGPRGPGRARAPRAPGGGAGGTRRRAGVSSSPSSEKVATRRVPWGVPRASLRASFSARASETSRRTGRGSRAPAR